MGKRGRKPGQVDPPEVKEARRMARLMNGIPPKPRGSSTNLKEIKYIRPILNGDLSPLGLENHSHAPIIKRFLSRLKEYVQEQVKREMSIDSNTSDTLQ